MPGTLSFYFYIIILVGGWNEQFASGCRYDLRSAHMICPVSAPLRVERRL